MSNSAAGEKMFNQTNQNDTSIEKDADPLPWLIHSLVEKQASHSQSKPTKTTTEPPTEAP